MLLLRQVGKAAVTTLGNLLLEIQLGLLAGFLQSLDGIETLLLGITALQTSTFHIGSVVDTTGDANKVAKAHVLRR